MAAAVPVPVQMVAPVAAVPAQHNIWRPGPEGIPIFNVPKAFKNRIVIQIVRAVNVIATDRNGLSDPYVKLKVQGYKHHNIHTTQHVHKTLNPVWNESHTFMARDNATLELRMYDKGTLSKDTFMGVAEIPVYTIPKNAPARMWVPLKKVKSGLLLLEFLVQPVTPEMLGPFGRTKFLASVQQSIGQFSRDFIMVLDKSGSMAGDSWKDAKGAVHKMAKLITKASAEGLSLYVFSDRFEVYPHITDHDVVEDIFKKQVPGGGTDLTGVLKAVFNAHFAGTKRATTVLVITDGAPNDQNSATAAIADAASKMTNPGELVVTIMQIGSDGSATAFLDKLATGAFHHPIVDVLTAAQMKGKHFNEIMDACLMI